MQKGFATFEVIFVTFIIVVLISVAIPNANHMIDMVALDYETKSIYTDLKFLQSLDRMTDMKDSHFSTNDDGNQITLVVYPEQYIFKKFSTSKIYDEHYFSHGVTASQKGGRENWQIKFDDMGKVSPAESNNLKLNSQFGKNAKIVFDSVGRIRGERGNEQTE